MTLARNSLYSALGSGIPVLVTIVTLPLLIGQIGLERYGVLAVAWLILVYVGQADFGLGRAVTQRIASADPAQASHIALTGIVMSAALGVVTALVATFIAHIFFADILNVSTEIRAEIVPAVWLIGASTFCVSLFAMLTGCLSGEERFGEVSLFVLITNSSLQIIPLLAAIFGGPHIQGLLLATLAARILGAILAGQAVWRKMLRGRAARISRSVAGSLLSYGKWIMVSTLTRPVMAMADRFIIGAQLGAVAVAAYSVPYQIASRAQLVPQAVMRVLFPRFSSLDENTARGTARNAIALLGNLSAPVMAGLIALADPLLRLWLGSDLDERSIILARILLAAFWVSGIASLAATFLQARDKPHFTAAWNVIELPFYCAAMFVASWYLGLVGFALVFLIRSVIESGVLAWKGELLDVNVLGRLLPAAIAIVAGVLLHPLLSGWKSALLATGVLGTVTLIAAHFAGPRVYRDRLYAMLGFGRAS